MLAPVNKPLNCRNLLTEIVSFLDHFESRLCHFWISHFFVKTRLNNLLKFNKYYFAVVLTQFWLILVQIWLNRVTMLFFLGLCHYTFNQLIAGEHRAVKSSNGCGVGVKRRAATLAINLKRLLAFFFPLESWRMSLAFVPQLSLAWKTFKLPRSRLEG